MDVLLEYSVLRYKSFTELCGWLVQIGCLIVSMQQTQMGMRSVSPGTHLVIQLVDHVKYGLDPGCHTWPRRVSLPRGKAQLAECLKRLVDGLFGVGCRHPVTMC